MARIAPILLAEDEESDAFLLRIALKKAGIPNPLVVAVNGREAIQYLNGDPPFSDRVQNPLPILLLVDLKMPIANGFDVLTWLQCHPDLKQLPAVVLTSSEEPEDRKKACQLGASDYLVKPGNPGNLVNMVHGLYARWIRT